MKFRLSDAFVDKYAGIKPPFGFNGLGEFVYLRTYSRLKDDGTNEKWHETVRRVVEGTYNMQKNWIEEHSLGWDNRKAQESAKEMYDRIFNMKFLPPGRGLWAMGTSIIEERGLHASLNNCFAGNEKYVTNKGLKTFSETVGTVQTILTEGGEWKDAPIVAFGDQEIYELVLIRQGIEKTIRTTANHRWFTKNQSDVNHHKGWQVRVTEELQEGTRLRYSFGYNPLNFSPQGVQHGFCFGDGTKGRIDLQLSKDESILTYFSENNKINRDNFVVIKDIPEHYKELPSLFWDRKYLYGWLAGYFAADGSVSSNGNITISSSNKANLEFFKELCHMLGIGTYSITLSSTSSNLKDERELYKLSLAGSTLSPSFFIIDKHRKTFEDSNLKDNVLKNWNVKSVRKTGEIEPVYCAVVEEKESFTLEDHIFTKNCAFCSTANIKEDSTAPFTFLMDASMLGVGVGFDVKGAGKITVKRPKKDTIKYVIPDSREGWVESLRLLLDSYFSGNNSVEFDYSEVREAGLPIKGFGGLSSGPGPLIDMHNDLRKVLDANVGDDITVTTITDIMNLIGKAVVAGNVRRTAEIVFGDPNDDEYINLKNYKRNPDREHFGWTSNNSVFAELGMDYTKIAELISINGEPGLAWLENMKSYSRMNNGPDNKDHRVAGGNPCLEQSLEHMELCCLVETFPDNHESIEDYIKTLKYAYLYAKTVTLGKTHWPETNKVMLRNRRIGCSMSGIAQFIANRGIDELKKWCTEGYTAIQKYDTTYSDWFAIPKSIKTTSVKPSGTVSLLAGATPGIHYPENNFYIRRVRLSNHSKMIPALKKAGYKIEPAYGSEETTSVIEIPVSVGKNVRTVKEVSMWEQLALAAFMQRYWADNQVSATVTFDKDLEGHQIPFALNYFQYQLKGISFLPRLEAGAYRQMPYEAISQADYDQLVKKLKPLNFADTNEEAEVEKFCNNDVCEIKR